MIRLVNIAKRYDLGEVQVTALDGVALTIERGEYVSVMGPSGSGKSTLLHIVGLLDAASEGSYFLEEVEITRATAEPKSWRCWRTSTGAA